MRVKQFLLAALLFLTAFTSGAATINQTLYINRGTFVTVGNTMFPYMAYNSTPSFSPQNTLIDLNTGDVLVVKVINNDSIVHGFDVKGYAGVNATINPGDSIIDTLIFSSEQVYIYYDSYLYPDNRYMGLGGMICVSNASVNKKFYWNIKEHETGFNNTIGAGGNVSWSAYDPDYFTINGLSHPDLQNDTTARVTGTVGDTIRIFMVNTGQSAHSIHFHGFHCKILYSTASGQAGWLKDTFPLKSMEGMVLEMIPDKVGEYSVHDHNLVAVSGGNTHPNGMFIIMLIQ
jgi:FtsP/CotA-like multicopper oxidase with cupredoxin domain